MSDVKNILVVLSIAILTAYCLFLNAYEIAATGIGALAGVLTTGSKLPTKSVEPPKEATP